MVTITLSTFKYIVGFFMMFAGVQTAILAVEHDHVDSLGWVYNNHWTLWSLAIIFFLSGAAVVAGKLFKKSKVLGYGLMGTYMSFLFGAIIAWVGYTWVDAIPNGTAAVITGALYLRWKYNIYYYEPPLDKVRAKMLA